LPKFENIASFIKTLIIFSLKFVANICFKKIYFEFFLLILVINLVLKTKWIFLLARSNKKVKNFWYDIFLKLIKYVSISVDCKK
jgi:hypothetical protein